ncbi:uncharacterized protein LOC114414406 [Glycine soja]|uniref:uncharacterized protein LOC114414406 n=1 Tax=Glycine soja TaxID=3848 RepID=UPI00103A2F93|nr:uncharacterized protein LOC114414406 [Glycine soja]
MVSGEHNLAMQLSSPRMKQPTVSDQSLSKTRISPSRHNIRSNKSGRSRRKNTNPSTSTSFPSFNLRPYDHINDHQSSNSPYYKGLTDQSLAIPEPQLHTPTTTTDHLLSSPYYKGLLALKISSWTPDDHPIPFPPNNSFSYLPSPYYRGLLTDYSALLSSIDPPPFSIKTTPPGVPTLKDLILDAAHHHVDFLTEESEVGNYSLEEIDVEVMDEEKPLREISVLEDKASEKMILEEMVIVEKPLRESVLVEKEMIIVEKPLRESVLVEKEMIIEEKPLRERVSETERSDHVEEKKALSLSVSESQCEEGGNVYQYTWATKYQPMSLDDFICNKDNALQLKAKVKEGCGCSHFIFEGPPSVGKRSMIRAMLREVFGADKVQVIEECRNFNMKGEMVNNLQVRVKKSLHHVEVNLSETKGYEKHVIVDLFKETYGQLINNSEPCCPENCKAIILYEAEKLSIESLLYIKWLLEKYKGCNKVFFCCSDESKLQPVKPLCITVRLSSPSTQELVQILENIGKEEGIKLSRNLVEKIILRSKNNLRQAIRSLEATCRNKDAVKDDDLILTGWEEDIFNIAKKVAEEQSPRQLYVIRRKLQSLMIHDVPPDFIYKSLVPELTNLVDESLRAGVAKLDKEFIRPSDIKFQTMKQFGHAQNKQAESDEKNYDSTNQNRLTYLKVEEFIAKFMSWYKNSSEKGNKQ